MKIILIRHGKTLGNIKKQYIGRTDESLCDEGENELKSISYPNADIVISSPLKRCIETAKIIYPDCDPIIYDDLRETDFGDFEGKNYLELGDDPNYRNWIDSGGKIPFPNGESIEYFKNRTIAAFLKAINDFKDKNTVSLVVHGGSIMAIMQHYNGGGFYDHYVGNGHGFIIDNNFILESEL